MTTVSKEKLSQAAQEMTMPKGKAATSPDKSGPIAAVALAEPVKITETAETSAPEAAPAAAATPEISQPRPEPRIRIRKLAWKRRAMSVKGDLEADTPIGRIIITMALLPSKTPCILQMPAMGEHTFRPIPCENVEEAKKLACSEIEALVRQLTITDIDPASTDAA